MKSSQVLLVVAGLVLAGAVVLKDALAQVTATAPVPAAVGAMPANVRVAVCNTSAVFGQYQKTKDLEVQRNERVRKLQEESQARQKRVEAIKLRMEGLKKDSPQYETELNNMQKEAIDLKSWVDFQQALIEREYFRLNKELYEEVLRAIEVVAKEKDIQIVLDRQSKKLESERPEDLFRQMESRKVLYWNDSLDITEPALARLNEAYRARSKPAAAQP